MCNHYIINGYINVTLHLMHTSRRQYHLFCIENDLLWQ